MCFAQYCDCFKAGAIVQQTLTVTAITSCCLHGELMVRQRTVTRTSLLRAAMFCGEHCGCLSCQNTVENKDVVQRKRQHILTRYPNAFDDKV